jgi:hypothetical protein
MVTVKYIERKSQDTMSRIEGQQHSEDITTDGTGKAEDT